MNNNTLDIVLGLLILLRAGGKDVCAEHDEIYAGEGVDEASLDSSDRAQLETAGWRYLSDLRCWRKFV